MQWWDSAETLYRIGFWLTLVASTAALLSLIVNYRVRSLDGRDIASLQSSNQRLVERAQPRTFTAAQDEAFLDIIRKAPSGKVQILWFTHSLDAEPFARHLGALLRSEGWTANEFGSEGGKTPVGLEIHVQSTQTAPSYTAILIKALEKVGYPPSIVERRDSPINDWLELVVGHNPKVYPGSP
jgi:hypothetical protein